MISRGAVRSYAQTLSRDPLWLAIRNHWHPLYRTGLVASLSAVLAWIHINMPGKYPDFTVFWVASVHASAAVYDSHFLTQLQHGPPGDRPFAYPPTFLAMILPLAVLPFKAAYIVWVSFSVTAFVEAGMRLTRYAWLALFSPTLMFAAFIGQTTLLFGALAIIGLVIAKDHPQRAGIALGVAACIKPHLLLFVPVVLVMERNWRALCWTVGTGAALAVMATLLFGIEIWPSWLNSLRSFIAINERLKIDRLGLAWPWSLFAVPLFLALIGHAIRDKDVARIILAALGGGMLLSPHAVFYEVTILLVPAVAMIGLTWRSLPVLYLLAGGAASSASLLVSVVLLSIPLSRREFRDRGAVSGDRAEG